MFEYPVHHKKGYIFCLWAHPQAMFQPSTLVFWIWAAPIRRKSSLSTNLSPDPPSCTSRYCWGRYWFPNYSKRLTLPFLNTETCDASWKGSMVSLQMSRAAPLICEQVIVTSVVKRFEQSIDYKNWYINSSSLMLTIKSF